MFFLLPQGVALSYALLPFQNEKNLFRFVLRSVCTNFSNGKLGGGSEEKMKVICVSFCSSLALHYLF